MYQELIINISSFFMLERMMKMENQEINYEEKIELLDEVLNGLIFKVLQITIYRAVLKLALLFYL